VDSYSQRGLTPRALELLFSERDKLHATGTAAVRVSVSYLEIYNETVYDLLGSPAADAPLDLVGPNLPRVALLEGDDGSLAFRNLSCHVADSCEEALGLLFQGDTARAVAETSSNATSSRSHCVFTAYVQVRPAGSDVIRMAKLHLVDLAGSERIGKTGTTDVGLLSESKHINLSLSYLEQVIVALQEKAVGLGRHHIPYRNSCLTSVLRDSLGGNARTSMVATLAPVSAALEEGVSTCRFAQRVAMITNQVVKNESVDPELVIKRLKQQVKDLKAELRLARDATAADGTGDADGDDVLGADEQRRLREAAHKFVADGGEGATSSAVPHTAGRLSVVHFLFRALRDIARAAAQQADGAAAVKAHVAQRDAEIGALLGVLLRTDAALCAPGGDGASRGAPALHVHPLRLPEEVAAPAFGPSFAEVMASRGDSSASDLIGLSDSRSVRAAAFGALTRSAVARTHTLCGLAAELRAAQAEAQRLADVANAARQGIQACTDEAKQRAAQRAQSAVAAALAGPAAEAAWKVSAAEAERKGAAAIEQHKGEYRAASASLEDVKRRMWDMHRAMEAATVAANEDLAFWARAVGGGSGDVAAVSSQAEERGRTSGAAGSEHGEDGVGDGGVASAMAALAMQTPPPLLHDVATAATMPPASLAPAEQHDDAAGEEEEDPPELAAMLTGDPDADTDIRAFYAATTRR
jgi:kinesin family protein 6/9